MKTTIEKIIGKPNDYRICADCGSLNWYENEECHICEHTVLLEDINKVIQWVQDEIEFYMNDFEYTEDECDNVKLWV